MGSSWVDAARAWLRGDAADHARFTAVSARLTQVSLVSMLVGVPHLLTAWWVGWTQVGLVALAVMTIAALAPLARRARTPEAVEAVGSMVLLLDLGVAIHTSGGAHSPLLPLVAVTAFSQAVAFRLTVLFALCGTAVVVTVLAVVSAPALPPGRTPPSWIDAVSVVVLLVVLCATVWAIVRAETSARTEARTDPLTGLHHRRALEPAWAELRARDVAADRSTGVLMVDLDHFKEVNDRHGHAKGDEVLVALGQRLRAALRPADVVVRMGGEEFAVLLPGADRAGALAAAERVRRAVAGQPVAGLPVTASVGATAAGTDDDLPALLEAADQALYAAKHAGRDRVVLSPPRAGIPAAPEDFPVP